MAMEVRVESGQTPLIPGIHGITKAVREPLATSPHKAPFGRGEMVSDAFLATRKVGITQNVAIKGYRTNLRKETPINDYRIFCERGVRK
jgi:hypothetical protein